MILADWFCIEVKSVYCAVRAGSLYTKTRFFL